MVYSAINVPYASLLGVMSPNPAERNTLATYRMMFAYIGSFIALLLFTPMVKSFGGDRPSDVMVGWMTAPQFGWFATVAVIAEKLQEILKKYASVQEDCNIVR